MTSSDFCFGYLGSKTFMDVLRSLFLMLPQSPRDAGQLVLVSACDLSLAMMRPAEAEPGHAIAMHGDPLYPADFSHFAYADPDAPKGGTLTVGEVGSFDNLNPFIVKGVSPQVSLDVSQPVIQRHTVESLMARGHDEPFSLYGLLAETVAVPPDRSWVEFVLRENAAFADGSPVTAEDVRHTWRLLRDQGRPNMRRYYGFVRDVEMSGRTVRFVFGDERNRELPLIIALMPILSKADLQSRTFTETTLQPLLGSGPYVVADVDTGRSITFRRNPEYWGAELPVNQGLHNFQTIRYEYFRDSTALWEAFKRGDVTVRVERNAKTWATGYDFPAFTEGRVKRESIPHGRPSGMYGLVFNTRRAQFADVRVREALTLLLDFDWINEQLFFGSFSRIRSYFDNSELSSSGRPATGRERELLAQFPDAVRPDILETGWQPTASGTPDATRAVRRKALQILSTAGWAVTGDRLVHEDSGRPLEFEILVLQARDERVGTSYARSLKGLGIDARVRIVDSTQFEQRRQTFDFDMIPFTWGGTLSPGNEQAFRFGSAEADIEGTYNLAGVRSPAVDALIAEITNAVTRDDLVASVRALDRVLLSGFYTIPLYYQPDDWWAYWDRVERPRVQPLTGAKLETWWSTDVTP